MHDIRFIRQNPHAFDMAMRRRSFGSDVTETLTALDKRKRAVQTEMETKLSQRNSLSRDIGKQKATGSDPSSDSLHMIAALKADIAELDTEFQKLDAEIESYLLTLPNILDDDVPDGTDESENTLLREVGKKPQFDFMPKDHVAIGEKLGQMDFAVAAKLSGARFVVLQGQLAKLERALAAFMLDTHINEHGYLETLPPALVRTETMTGTGQLPKFADDLFQTTDNRWLIPTAEVPLTNIVADTMIAYEQLPIRMTAYTPCFRAEAGAAGRDTRGLIRQHQFSKVELVSVTRPDMSDSELARMTNCAEVILQRLGLAYRVLRLCSGDTGFSAQQTLDIEVWLPGQNAGQGMFREISSCSNCGPFQARRMKARTKNLQTKSSEFVHTLNGSALAVGRCMIAILENGQQKDGTVRLPDVLHPYMQTDRLVPRSA